MDLLDDYSMWYIFTFLSSEERLKQYRICERWRDVIKIPWPITCVEIEFYSPEEKEAKKISSSWIQQIIRRSGEFITKIKLFYDGCLGNYKTYITFNTAVHYTDNEDELFISDMITRLTAECPNVSYLGVQYFNRLRNNNINLLNEFIRSRQKLEVLKLFDDPFIQYTEDDITLNLEQIPLSVEVLHLSNCLNLSEFQLCTYLRQARNLRRVQLWGCRLVENILLPTIAAYTTHLHTLHISQYDNSQSLRLRYISLLINLECLCFENFANSLTDDVLIEIATGCKKIKIFNMWCCDVITDIGIDGFVSLLPELDTLELGLVAISGISFDHINRKLRVLKLTDCNLSNRKMSLGISKMWNLSEIVIYNSFPKVNFPLQLVVTLMSLAITTERNFVVLGEGFQPDGLNFTFDRIFIHSNTPNPIRESSITLRYRPYSSEILHFLQNFTSENFPCYKIIYENYNED